MIVVDTNQAHRLPIPRGFAQKGLCIPELVLAETVVRPRHVRSRVFRLWRRYRVRLGLQPSQVLADLAELDAQGIAVYHPFAPPSSTERRLLSRALRGLDDDDFRAWAAKARQSGLNFGKEMEGRASRVRRLLKAMKAGRATDMTEVAGLGAGEKSYVGSLMISSVRNGGTRTPRIDDDETLYAAMKSNPFLKNFTNGLVFHAVAISRGWSDQSMNIDPTPKRNDLTDLTLPLYVRDDRDIVWTEDTFARNLLKATDCGVRIKP